MTVRRQVCNYHYVNIVRCPVIAKFVIQEGWNVQQGKLSSVFLCLLSLCCNRGIAFLPYLILCHSFLFALISASYRMFCARILRRFWWNSRAVIITTNRLNDYILGKIVTGIREQGTRGTSRLIRLRAKNL